MQRCATNERINMSTNNNTEKRQEENEFIKLRIENGILIVEYKPNVKIDPPTAPKIVRSRLKFQGDKEYPVLCITHGITDFTASAQFFMATKGSTLIKAICFVTPTCDGLWARINFYTEVHSNHIPTHLVGTEEDARDFLSAYI